MPDKYATLANVLAGPSVDSLPGPREEPGPTDYRDTLHNAHAWLTRNALEPLQYAAFYPPRVLSQYMDPERQSAFWSNPRLGTIPGRPVATPNELQILADTQRAVDGLGAYKPGPRASDNIEDRRPRSPWDY